MWLMIDVKNRIETEIQVFIWIEDVDDETKKMFAFRYISNLINIELMMAGK